jgi:hypothetical protein
VKAAVWLTRVVCKLRSVKGIRLFECFRPQQGLQLVGGQDRQRLITAQRWSPLLEVLPRVTQLECICQKNSSLPPLSQGGSLLLGTG